MKNYTLMEIDFWNYRSLYEQTRDETWGWVLFEIFGMNKYADKYVNQGVISRAMFSLNTRPKWGTIIKQAAMESWLVFKSQYLDEFTLD